MTRINKIPDFKHGTCSNTKVEIFQNVYITLRFIVIIVMKNYVIDPLRASDSNLPYRNCNVIYCFKTGKQCFFMHDLYYFYNQVAVVPKGKDIPFKVSGLLVYRKENNKLFVRSNGSWSELAEKKKVCIRF